MELLVDAPAKWSLKKYVEPLKNKGGVQKLHGLNQLWFRWFRSNKKQWFRSNNKR